MSSLLVFFVLAVKVCCIGIDGTWMSKSKTVITGPRIYDPVDELIYEPSLPGVCYSFDKDGYWEQAIYSVTSNPIEPKAPTAAIIWQHGKYTIHKDGSMSLKPYPSDGRKLFSDPSKSKESIYMRYNQEEKIDHFDIEYDYYYGKYKLQLYSFDGSKKQPLWLEYNPPMMLPTSVLNPTNEKEKNALANINRKLKRSIENIGKTQLTRVDWIDIWMFHIFSVLGLAMAVAALAYVLTMLSKTRRKYKLK
ncbi:Protein rot1 [Yamadazyma tenuis]|uniref:Protein ROT1 n=1 Tax=Candida tenuis (strain ATCC 10573 / BCRC 21748 / CBS 615 / JCM 9827 / NBRC 10315 / NRRL Y-1498 / VKM Y-70) TaxID=590646 RepID=G3B939_CANTC|nr:uncharacterized protein CANTEDRAFT_95352 [Yamadazyma tenuis ATCC 10573]EGV62455.1 hypothetical protein CANTEDRAFT_95352 [Yamadazyma tenuis ATCC 10573]WEJ93740.1 Protein rot1 [Yamadazyma tenuis]